MSHIYETVGGETNILELNWTEDSYQTEVFKILYDNKDKILIENAGHDHLADMRAHSASRMFDSDNECMMVDPSLQEEQFFMGKLINPSITPTRGSNPGYTTLEYHSDTNVLDNVHQTFLSLDSQAGLPYNAAYTDFEYLYIDYNEDFGLEQLTAGDIALLNERLMSNDALY